MLRADSRRGINSIKARPSSISYTRPLPPSWICRSSDLAISLTCTSNILIPELAKPMIWSCLHILHFQHAKQHKTLGILVLWRSLAARKEGGHHVNKLVMRSLHVMSKMPQQVGFHAFIEQSICHLSGGIGGPLVPYLSK